LGGGIDEVEPGLIGEGEVGLGRLWWVEKECIEEVSWLGVRRFEIWSGVERGLGFGVAGKGIFGAGEARPYARRFELGLLW
jgi:hypothetical protein